MDIDHITIPKLYALIIGINEYEHDTIPNLNYAVADAQAMAHFLLHRVGAEASRLHILHNAEATREAIINHLRLMAERDFIKQGDPILIFYAGHGSQTVAPKGWPCGAVGNPIEMLLPSDFLSETSTGTIQGIPDILVSNLLKKLADAKGANITVILDCCHSGSGTRKGKSDDHSASSRGVDLPQYRIIPTFKADLGTDQPLPDLGTDRPVSDSHPDQSPSNSRNQDQRRNQPVARASKISEGFASAGLASHVLLAACREDEVCMEIDGRGRFSKALLAELDTRGTDSISYEDLIGKLPDIPGQHPQCEGIDKKKLLFRGMVSSVDLVFYTVSKSGSTYKLEAGNMLGVTADAKFRLYAEKDLNSQCLGVASVKSPEDIGAQSTILLPELASTELPSGRAYAVWTWLDKDHDFRVCISGPSKLSEEFGRVEQYRENHRTHGKRGIALVTTVQLPEILATMQDDDAPIVFATTDKFCVVNGFGTMPMTIPCDFDSIIPVISRAADFYWHLRRTSSDATLSAAVKLKCYELKETSEYDQESLELILAADGNNLVTDRTADDGVDGTIEVSITEEELRYGFEIESTTGVPLYAALFYFDMSDLSITPYYQPNAARDTGMVPSIPPRGSLMIGYGHAGHSPRSYFLREGQNIDIGFLKLFVTSRRDCFLHIEQSSPFGQRGSARSSKQARHSLWGSKLVGIVQRRP